MMPYLQGALTSLIDTLIGLYLVIFVLRFLLELIGVEYRNPLVQVIATLTDPPLRLARSLVPTLYGIDLAALLLIWGIALGKLVLRLSIADYSFHWSGALMLSLADALNIMQWVFLITVLARVVLSWVAPRSQHPAVRIVVGLSEPVMAPFRRVLPSLGGLDLSPILTLLALRLVQQLLLTPLTNFGVGLL